jgi:hypothetical protein
MPGNEHLDRGRELGYPGAVARAKLREQSRDGRLLDRRNADGSARHGKRHGFKLGHDPVNSGLIFRERRQDHRIGSATLTFQGIGVADPESRDAAFSAFEAGDVTWTGTLWPPRISTELFDTGNTSLSARLTILNSAFGTKQVAFICYPRSITAAVNFSANKEIYFTGGDYTSTFAGSGEPAFGLASNTLFHGPRSARLWESTGAFGTRIIGPTRNDIVGQYYNIIVRGLTFKGDPSAVSDGSSSTILLGNTLRGRIEGCFFDDIHSYAAVVGGAGSGGFYADDAEIVDNHVLQGSEHGARGH